MSETTTRIEKEAQFLQVRVIPCLLPSKTAKNRHANTVF